MTAAPTGTFALIRRYPYCTGCIVATILLLVGAWFLRAQTLKLQNIHGERTRRGEETLATLVGGSTTRQELAEVRDAVRRVEDNLVIETNLAENLWYFYKLEEQTRVHFSELHQLSSPSSDKSPLYRRVPYTIRVTGTYDQLAAFLLGLETGPRLVRVTAFSYGRSGREEGAMALDLSIDMLGKK